MKRFSGLILALLWVACGVRTPLSLEPTPSPAAAPTLSLTIVPGFSLGEPVFLGRGQLADAQVYDNDMLRIHRPAGGRWIGALAANGVVVTWPLEQ
jgi:hypothetical protein